MSGASDVLMVEPRLLQRVIRRHRGLSGLGLRVLHERCYTLPRDELLKLVSVDELGDVRELPERPILVPKPPEGQAVPERDLFHARVHRLLEARDLSPAVVRARIHAVGQTEFDEIRFVLRQDDLLLPPRDDVATYIEFAARYLELRYFAPAELERTFPALLDHDAIDAVLARDVDLAELGITSPPPQEEEEAAPPEAAESTPPPVQGRVPESRTESDRARSPSSKARRGSGLLPATEEQRTRRQSARKQPVPTTGGIQGHALTREADVERARGNLARSAILAFRAGEDGRRDLAELVARLPIPERDRGRWVAALVPLARAAAATPWRRTAPARLLYDLVKAATDRERERADVDVLEWLLSLGKVPIVRPLPAAQGVRYVKHLGRAVAKAARVRLPEPEREALSELLHHEHARAAAAVRAELRPRIDAVLDEVGLRSSNVPERVARRKLVEELLDRVIERGFLSLGHLRDALARSNLKLPDLSGPLVLWRGDALLRADLRLERAIDGVYRRGEVYLRGLQKLSSLFFATRPGRALTLYLLLPVVAAYVVLEGLQHIVGPATKLLFDAEEPHIFTWPRCAALAGCVFALMHSPAVRREALRAARAAGRGLHAVFVAAPRAVWRSPPVQRLVRSRSVHLLAHWLLKPALLGGLVFLAVMIAHVDTKAATIAAGALFLLLNVLQTTRFYAVAEDIVVDRTISGIRLFGHRIIPGLFRLLLDFFRRLLELIDRALVAVDELLRFRRGESRLALVAKGILGTIWGGVTYLVRIYVNLLIEPTVNPVKHFPVVTVAGKIMLPLAPTILSAMTNALSPLVGGVVAGSIAGMTLFVLPGFWGFLVWELQESWRLYAANRPRTLRPVLVGSHGETVGRLLRPGLHSGTVPKTYHRLRRAAWAPAAGRARAKRAGRQGAPSAARHRETLHHVEEAVARFVSRELVALLEESGSFPRGALRVGGVRAASNRLRVALTLDGEQAVIAYEEQSGWIVAGHNWIVGLPPARRDALGYALDGLDALAGVDLRRADIERRLGIGVAYDIADVGLVVWPDGDDAGFHEEVVMPLVPERHEVLWEEWVRRWSATPATT